MTNYKIEKNIPLPARKFAGGPSSKYPIGLLEPGDSVFIAEAKKAQQQNIRNLVAHYRKKNYPSHYATRKVKENGVEGIRVWRLE